jgi:uncharacterized protein
MQHPNIALVQSLYAAFMRGDGGVIAASLAPDVRWHSSGTDETSGTFLGVPAVLGHLLGGNHMDEFSLEVVDLLASDERVAVVARSSGRRAAHTIANDFVQVLRIAEGVVVEVWDYKWDQKALAAFSALPWQAGS